MTTPVGTAHLRLVGDLSELAESIRAADIPALIREAVLGSGSVASTGEAAAAQLGEGLRAGAPAVGEAAAGALGEAGAAAGGAFGEAAAAAATAGLEGALPGEAAGAGARAAGTLGEAGTAGGAGFGDGAAEGARPGLAALGAEAAATGAKASAGLGAEGLAAGEKFGAGAEKASAGLGLISGGLIVGLGAVELFKAGLDKVNADTAGLAQIAQGIKSTGNEANISVEGVRKLTDEIANFSGQDGGDLIKSAQVLQTFTAIQNKAGDQNDIFNQSVLATANLSAKLGGDASASAVQIGKALNDPVKGVTALQRVGVSFTASQKDLIKSLVASGDTLGAQKVILKELNTEFGGAAKAFGDTGPGQIAKAKNAFAAFGAEVVTVVLPIIGTVLRGLEIAFTSIGESVKFLFETGKELISGFAEPLGAALGNIGFELDAASTPFEILRDVSADLFNDLRRGAETILNIVLPVFRPLSDVIGGLFSGGGGGGAEQKANRIADAFGFLATLFRKFEDDAPAIGAAIAGVLGPLVQGAADAIPRIVDAVGAAFAFLQGAVARFGPQFKALFLDRVQLAGTYFRAIVAVARDVFPLIVSIVRQAADLVVAAFNVIAPPVTAIVGTLVDLFFALGKDITDAISLIIPPTVRVFEQIARVATTVITALIGEYEKIVPALRPALEKIQQLFAKLSEIVQFVAGVFVHDLLPVLLSVGEFLIGVLGPVITFLATNIFPVLGAIIRTVIIPAFNVVLDIIGFLVNLFTGDFTGALHSVGALLSDIGKIFVGLGTIVANALLTIVEFVASLPGRAVQALVSLAGDLLQAGLDGIAGLYNGITSIDFGKVASGIVGFLIGGLVDGIGSLFSVGESLVSAVIGGIGDLGGKLIDTLAQAARDAKNAIVSVFTGGDVTGGLNSKIAQQVHDKNVRDAQQLGRDSAGGYVQGLNDSQPKVAAGAQKMADTAVRSASGKLQIQSPSKAFGLLGALSVDGYVGDLLGGLPKVRAASTRLATTALDGAAAAASSRRVLAVQQAVGGVTASQLGPIAPVVIGGAAGQQPGGGQLSAAALQQVVVASAQAFAQQLNNGTLGAAKTGLGLRGGQAF